MSPRAPAVTVNQGKGAADRPDTGDVWRCCCCPAQGRSTQPEHALRDHWARDCPASLTRQEQPNG